VSPLFPWEEQRRQSAGRPGQSTTEEAEKLDRAAFELLPGRKLAGDWRFAREAVLDWLARR
jgi:hypothetical protein